MALDNAQFISELSITDPPGTDPLSQGDDHIRTAKRAVQQSFPNIDKAVTQTADQMLQMAIKNEANVFTAAQTISKTLTLTMPSAIGDSVSIFFQDFTNGVNRWELVEIAEDGINPLTFGLVRYDSLGVFQSAPWVCRSDTGIIDFDHVPTIQGNPIWIAGEIRMLIQGAILPSGNWFIANGTNGTLGLQDRLLGAQGVFFGTQSPFLDAQTTVGPTTDASNVTLPAHNHRLLAGNQSGLTDTTFAHAAENTVAGANRGNSAPTTYRDTSAVGTQIIEDAGSGSGSHSHGIPELEVETAGLDAFQVMPFTYFMQVIQYVP